MTVIDREKLDRMLKEDNEDIYTYCVMLSDRRLLETEPKNLFL